MALLGAVGHNGAMGSVSENYATGDLAQRILDALIAEGIDPGALTPDILAPLDHLHTRGVAATLEHLDLLDIDRETRVLDLGCGIGGPARFLAGRYGCRVEGIDLMAEYIAAGRMLTERCGLSGLVELRQGDALDLPYGNGVFDLVWCQNVAMNIADKGALYREVRRVLAPGGTFTFTDYVAGPDGEAIYPTVWARDPSASFIVTEEEMNGGLAAAAFRIAVRIDDGVAIRDSAARREGASHGGGGLSPRVVFGDDTGQRVLNAARNVIEKRLTYLRVVAVAD